jgi:pimeloyl-ACP methyl ester carboxylesterase
MPSGPKRELTMNLFTKIKTQLSKHINNKSPRAIIAILALAFLSLTTFTSTVFADEMPKDKMVNINDHALHMMSLGEGEFTVIFESGFGSDLSHWRKVAPAISKKAKIVVYSRAGYGQSDPVAKPRTLIESSSELSDLLTQAKLKPPFILVGHSYGSHILRTYAAQHPDKVAGMVLVEPANEQFIVRLKQLDKAKTESFLDTYKTMIPEKLKAENEILLAIDERGSLPDFGPLPDVPAAILTSMVQEHPQFIIHSKEGKKIWRELHANLFNQFTTARHIVTMDSGHNIATQEPELVIEAITTVIDQASERARKSRFTEAMNDAITLISHAEQQAAEKLVFEILTGSPLNSAQINALGYQYLANRNGEQKHHALATIILKYNMIHNQNAANAFDSYGESLLAIHDPQEARVQFLQAIKLMELKDKHHTSLKGFKANLAKAEQAIEQTK